MEVTVKYLMNFRRLAQRKEEVLCLPEGISLRELLEQRARAHGMAFAKELFAEGREEPGPYALVFLNGHPVGQEGLEAALSQGDVVVITGPVSGGDGQI